MKLEPDEIGMIAEQVADRLRPDLSEIVAQAIDDSVKATGPNTHSETTALLNKHLLTPSEVSKVTRRAVQTLATDRHKRKGIPCHKVGGRVMYRSSDVLQYIEDAKITTL